MNRSGRSSGDSRGTFARVRALSWLLLWALPIGACDCSSDPGPGCETSADCEGAEVCVDGRCVPPDDAGPGSDSGSVDAGGEVCRDIDRDGFEGETELCPSGLDCADDDALVNPDADELCGNGLDDDCDGEADEDDCICNTGDRIACYTGEPATRNEGICRTGIAICLSPGEVGECRGETTPGEESCNLLDDDCDGEVDEGLRNACGECSDVEPMEMCGNEIDDDCDGLADEDCECDYRCACPDMTSCECRPPTNQPCYEGPFGTEGVGACAGGRRDCIEDAVSGGNRWGTCAGEVLPSEECAGDVADGVDDDCDGVVDEGCADADSDGTPYPADCDDGDADIYPGAPEICNGRDDDCDGIPDEGVTNGCGGCFTPEGDEECGNGLDDDCNGMVDDGCSCEPGASQECYGGPEGTAGVGSCAAGTQTCSSDEFTAWGACEGMVLPEVEVCGGGDEDCDGEVDERWAVGSNRCGFCDGAEVCDGEDQDCDGRVDEGVSNACGACEEEPVEVCDGEDDDCDGIVDEGVVNACGTCPPEPCFTDTWDTPSDCEAEGRDCEGVEPHPDFPDGVTLSQNSFDNDFIYLAVTQRNQVAKVNTETGAVEWQVTSHGSWPSRTAVAVDGSVWVANRALSAPSDPNQSNVVHLNEADGSLICRAPFAGLARGLAIDGDGNVWAGTFNGMEVIQIDGTEVEPDGTCRILRRIAVGVNVYGLAADSEGYVWTSSSPTVRIEVATGATESITNPTHYGIAADGVGNMWFGGWRGGGTVHAIRPDRTILDTGVGQITAVTVHPDGSVWGSGYGVNQVVRFDGATGAELCRANTMNGTNPHGVAVDRRGRVWSPNRYGGYVNVYDPDTCMLLESYPVDAGQELYSYSDMTGHLLRTFIAPEGWWRQVFDSGYADAYWTTVEWDSTEPAGTGVEIFVRVADTEAGLDGATPCGPFTSSPADLSTCAPALGRGRYLRVEARLFRSMTDERPILHSAEATWAY
ncbi:MAG: hypothetical protein CMN31_22800 [Sandaracinus sp.]|nr:hypothetical protein [Myxococcales bacterium]MAT28455.1 hypothetical protein [Sandaracinus sp.]MBJ74120.1 hypothetical protein [Sandaracinus sp.]